MISIKLANYNITFGKSFCKTLLSAYSAYVLWKAQFLTSLNDIALCYLFIVVLLLFVTLINDLKFGLKKK